MSLNFSCGRIVLLLCALTFVGCKGMPFTSSDDSSGSAPDFGLSSVPRQYEPPLEEGDTSTREQLRTGSLFDAANGDDDFGSEPDGSQEGSTPSRKSSKNRPSKQLPESEEKKPNPAKLSEDDFNP